MDSQPNEQAPEFSIQRLYIKDVSFESPQAPEVFNSNLQPMINLNIHTHSQLLAEHVYEAVLSATVTATANDKTVFLIEVKQAGIFLLKNIDEKNLTALLNVTCPTILFPYLREMVSDLAARGGFQHFYLAPINFEALYLNNVAQNEATVSA